jgi:hypothetical protein
LADFLKVDEKYSHLFLFKKLVKTIEICNINQLFNSIGLRKVSISAPKSAASSAGGARLKFSADVQDPQPRKKPMIPKSQ